ncbi:triose-phosphate isomerase [Peptococcaceae bacterium]|nr:triose-phosphate isomerase [Peptococcaceae bacterium]
MRKTVIAGNWKMNKTIKQAVEYIEELKSRVSDVDDVEIVVFPSFTALLEMCIATDKTNISIGAQNLHWEKSGAFTGEISAEMLREVGCGYVIIGHSERRQYFGETDESVNKKIKAALKHGLIPVVCVGETLPQREEGLTEQIVEAQVKRAVDGIAQDDIAKLIVAYEPVWAIGTSKNASSDDAQQVIANIRDVLKSIAGDKADSIRILYGGSVKPDNIGGFIKEQDIDGALVGGASLNPLDFSEIITRSRGK